MSDARHLEHAARLALRGHGGAEPNPLVGCVIVSQDGRVVGWGYHRQCGDAHAEVKALRMAGEQARGATAYVTLEPCNHTGRTGPCSEALIEAGIARVVIARRDPHPDAGGGIARLQEAGIQVSVDESCRTAVDVSEPFVHRVRTGLPWVIAKWAQTLDGRIATRTGESQWISNEASRRMVHRERGRVDAILTGIGTVLADDPLLTARNVRQRRIARRVVIDPQLKTPLEARIVHTAAEAPTTIVCCEASVRQRGQQAEALHAAGVELLAMTAKGQSRPRGGLSLANALQELVRRHDVTNVLVEAGPGLISSLFAEGLVNEAWVFIAPLLLGDEEAKDCLTGMTAERLTDGISMQLIDQRRRGCDMVLRYRITPARLRERNPPA